MKDWDEVVAFACALPDVAMASFYGTPCPKVNGKAFVSPGREPDSFHVMSPHDEKAVLIETDPDTFWQTDHYRGWPGLLVRYGSADPERVQNVIRRAWWDRAKTAQRAAFGERPSRFARFVAIDWSGAIGARQRGIAVAECTPGNAAPTLVRPSHIWSREEVLDWLLATPDDSLIGFDLGPSLPFVDRGAFFPGWAESPPDARGLWALVERICADDPHVSVSSFVDHPQASRHFRRHGRRTGDLFEPGRGRLRETERAQQRQRLSPYSNLNLVGAAQVGKSSLTGMRVLHRLDGRVAIWPFDPLPARGSVVVELYTSIAAVAAGRSRARSKMRSHADLDTALTALGSAPTGGAGPISDHVSDAILTAAWMRANAHRRDLWHPPGLTPDIARTEGWTFGVT